MKAFRNIWLTLLLLGNVSMGFVACGGDDDEGGSGSSEIGILDKKLGLRLTSVRAAYNGRTYDNIRYYYTDKNKLDYLDWDGYKLDFSYNPNVIYDKNDDEEDITIDVVYSSEGYIKKMNLKAAGGAIGTASYTYDSKGHLTKVSSSVKAYAENYNENITLTWKNDLLTRIVWIDTIDEETDTYTTNFNYDGDTSVENKYFQFAPGLMQFAGLGDGEYEEAFAYVGLLGKGPKQLPSSMTEDDRTYNFRYTLNDNGSLYSAYDGSYKTYYYSYDYLNDQESTNAKSFMPTDKSAVRHLLHRSGHRR